MQCKKTLIDELVIGFFVHCGVVFHFLFIVMDANGWEENRSKIENNVESHLDSAKAYSICDLKKDFF